MTIIVPGALFAAGVSLYLFHQYNRVKETKQEERRESLNEIRQQCLQHLIEQKRKESGSTSDQAETNTSEGEKANDPV